MRVRECCWCGGTGKVKEPNPAWLRERRLAAGVGLRTMAKRLGYSAAYVSDVERGRRAVPRDWLMRYGLLTVPHQPGQLGPHP